MIVYCTPMYKSFDLCCKSIDAVMAGSVKPDRIIIVDNSIDRSGLDYLTECGLFERYSNITIRSQNRNIGVAASWNIFMDVGADYTFIANDDIQVGYRTLELMIKAVDDNPDQIFFAGSHDNNTFSFFLLTQRGYRLIGKFDETFWPAYFEDNDYGYRMKLLDYYPYIVPNATYEHVGSSTIARYTPEEMVQHHKNFRSNGDYYRYKWGGPPMGETLKKARGT